MRRLSLLFIYSLFFSVTTNAANTLTVKNPWVAAAPPNSSVMAGYMEIINTTNQAIDILSISSPNFSSVEMHLSKESEGFAKMLPQKKLSIKANDKLILKSGSYHLMLIKPEKWFKIDDKIKLNFKLSNNENLVFDTRVKKTKFPTMKCAAGKCGTK